ncbi:hypothetical protein M9H77_14380 [Catharanthus roseus]|uniref:Uncharacterized protein n=1 Tax=Catharanthus roseus TaxID=4058 RepID=A0ACC0BMZ7_CATRO|nr:hypothetical protein M9H77_14380 [Catharanthus roseus]
MRTGITVSWIADVYPCDTLVPSDVLITGVRQCLNSYSRTIPNTNSPMVPGPDEYQLHLEPSEPVRTIASHARDSGTPLFCNILAAPLPATGQMEPEGGHNMGAT